jgi:hypothetical protein
MFAIAPSRTNPDFRFIQRRDTLNRLIDLTHSHHSTLKCFAAGHIRLFFKDFPDLEEEAINAVYDLCEDQVSKVRIPHISQTYLPTELPGSNRGIFCNSASFSGTEEVGQKER